MDEPQQQTGKPKDDERKGTVGRRWNPDARPRRPSSLSSRCLLIRNIPKGFLARSDLTDKNQSIRVRRMVYCEESNGSIMVEFASAAERNKILSLDYKRRRQTRQRLPDQEVNNGSDNSDNSATVNPYAFEVKVQVERCASERFVRSIFNNTRKEDSSPLLTGYVTNTTSPSTVPSSFPSSSSSLVRRCVVIRKYRGENAEEDDYEIPEAPPYNRKGRSHDTSISGDSINQQQQQQQHQSSPLEIRSGSLCEVVVRGVTLRKRANLMPAILVELESEESVERILLAEDSKKSSDSALPTTLAIRIKLLSVKSERYANLCFGNTKAPPIGNKNNHHSNERNGGKDISVDDVEGDNGDEEVIQVTEEDKRKDVNKDRDCQMDGNTEEKTPGGQDENANVTGSKLEDEKINKLEKEIRVLRSEMGRWKARAEKAKIDENKDREGASIKATADSSDEKTEVDLSTPSQIQSGTTEEPNYEHQLLEERRRQEALQEQILKLSTENDRLKATQTTDSSQKNDNKALESCQQHQPTEGIEGGHHAEVLLIENEKLIARVTEIDRMQSEAEDSKEHQKLAEQARKKLEEENSGLLRYVLELEEQRNGQELAQEERHKEMKKEHSELLTRYRSLQVQADQSATDLRKAIGEKHIVLAELEGFKSAWRTRMETQRRLEQSKGKEDNKVCFECETVKFYALVQKASSTNENSDNGEAETGEDNPVISPEKGLSVDEIPKADSLPLENGQTTM